MKRHLESSQKVPPHFSEWQTPEKFFLTLNEEHGFTLDAAASHDNALLPRYCTVEGKFEAAVMGWNDNMQSSQIASTHGLDPAAWEGETVFVNPPYDSTLGAWVALAAAHVAKKSVILLPPSVDTKWFWENIWHEMHFERLGTRQASRSGCDLHFYQGRLRFLRPDPEHEGMLLVGPAPRAGNMWAIFS